MEIQGVCASQILDSRGLPTVEVTICCGELGAFTASVPSGASTGSREACELRDGNKAEFLGKGVTKAVHNAEHVLGKALVEEKAISVTDQAALDAKLEEIDGTEFKTNLGANAILALSIAICRAGAAKKKVPVYQHINDIVNLVTPNTEMSLPSPFFNVLNGGKHADNPMACQEIMFTVKGANMSERIRKGSEIFHHLKALLKADGHTTNVGDEGGFAPGITPQQGITYIAEAAKKAGHEKCYGIGFDFAASEFCEDGKYNLDFKSKEKKPENLLTPAQFTDYYLNLIKENPQIVSIEDPFSEHDGDSFAGLVAKVDVKKCQIVADDLTVTNPKIIKECAEKKQANALLVKLNQIGSVSSSIKACNEATTKGWSLMVSHRSGETCDDFAADFSVGVGAKAVKFGAPSRGERVVKYNRLMKIEKMSKIQLHKEQF